MCNLCKKTALIIFLLLAFSPQQSIAAEIKLGGYYKNLFINSKTLSFFPPAESYFLDLNRLRLKLDGELNESISFNMQYDNEYFVGNYLETNEFSFAIKNRQEDSSIDLTNNYIDNKTLLARQRIYRAYVDVALSDVDLRIGRQRIAWGTAMMWNPMDILNPFNPIQLERQERQGIDAVLMDWDYNALSRTSLVYAKRQSGNSVAARWQSNQKEFDLSLMAGRFLNNTVVGFDFAGQVAAIGVRGEATQTYSGKESRFFQAVVGADYTFASSLSFTVEMYFNEQGSVTPSAYQFTRLLLGDVQSLARHYLGGYAGYDITPLIKLNGILITNLDDNSQFFSPSLVYSMTDNIETTLAIQMFNGVVGSEFGTFENLYTTQLQWFF